MHVFAHLYNTHIIAVEDYAGDPTYLYECFTASPPHPVPLLYTLALWRNRLDWPNSIPTPAVTTARCITSPSACAGDASSIISVAAVHRPIRSWRCVPPSPFKGQPIVFGVYGIDGHRI